MCKARRILILISDGDVDPGAIDLKKTMESEEKVVVFSDSTPWDAMGRHGMGSPPALVDQT